jgi:large subunit ribosomal protein L21
MAKTTSKKAEKAPTKKAPVAAASSFAVIKTGGKQYRVSEGMHLNIEKMNDVKVGDTVTFSDILLTENGSDTKIGTPFISGAAVKAEVLELGKADKVIIFRYKQKNRSGTPRNGHRQPFMKVKVTSIA